MHTRTCWVLALLCAACGGTNESGPPFDQMQDGASSEQPGRTDEYENPAAPMGPLPQNGSAIQNAIITNQPIQGGTPTAPALQGAFQYAQDIAEQNPTHKVVIVLATDGAPNDCDSTLQSVSAIAANAVKDGIETYVIGIGNINGLNQIADAGGTGEAFIVDADPVTASGQFLAALDAVRTRGACD